MNVCFWLVWVLIMTTPASFNQVQSAYRSSHSTETAILKIFIHAYENIEAKSSTFIVAIDISSALDNICHSKLLDGLQQAFGLKALHSHGSHRIWGIEVRVLKSAVNHRLRHISIPLFLRARCAGHYYFLHCGHRSGHPSAMTFLRERFQNRRCRITATPHRQSQVTRRLRRLGYVDGWHLTFV